VIPDFPQASRWRALPLVGGLAAVLLDQGARAEDTIHYKFQAWNENSNRIQVNSHYALFEKALSPTSQLRVIGTVDTITGATPTGEPAETWNGPVPLASLEDERTAGSVEVSEQWGRAGITVGYARSTESDYASDGVSLNTVIDFNEKATLLRLGVAGTADEIRVFFTDERQDKRTYDLLVGVTQVINARTTLTANLTHGRAEGYLTDPYKIIRRKTEILPGVVLPLTFPENRPGEREKWIGYVAFNRAWPEVGAGGALEASYRLYHDSFGVDSHTVAFGWLQKVREGRVTVHPQARVYRQSAADFYRVTLDDVAFVPTAQPNPAGPFYAADWRLAELETLTVGVAVTWNVRDWLSVDATYDRYVMRGRDGVTSAQAFPDANVFTLGVRLWR